MAENDEIKTLRAALEKIDGEIVDTLFSNLYGKPYQDKLAALRLRRRTTDRLLKAAVDAAKDQQQPLF